MIRYLAILALAAAASGCTVITVAKGGGGVDLAPIQPGVSRSAAEAVVGAPVTQWTSPAGVRFATYEYDAGSVPKPVDAAAFALMDVITFGMWELVDVVNGGQITKAVRRQRTTGRVVISYDGDDTVLGVFGELDELPVDGRPRPP
ncbi:MAG: hypothetical protein HYR51_09175 [Candidatus Rokubacteria bacterium]|nr:hypothetical protein [Candidatus Rokubacteria bacterium]